MFLFFFHHFVFIIFLLLSVIISFEFTTKIVLRLILENTTRTGNFM